MFIDWTYVVLVLPAVIFSIWCSARVQSTFKKYSAVPTRRGVTGADAARRVLDANGLTDVRIERVAGNLTDHYDPRTNVIRLSESVYGSATAAAVGVAAHEAGHAVQHAQGYFPIKLRSAIIPITNIGSQLAMPLVLLGLIFSSAMLVDIGIIAFSMSTLFQLITLPVEFNASRRAVATLESSCVSDTEVKGAKAVLRAAALTYVAALAVSLASLLRIILLFGNRNRRD